ncbi:MAG: 3'(2'),5'-bisphosphate nucleotidase CysQ [Paracoccaceae bacterium]|nr:3'(2'),5'-bisphosphate nucleotidase CysQ [Paracoccaceae bacterium]
MPANDLDLLIGAARAAGQIALRHWGKSPRTWEKPDGAGPVTEADLEVDRALADALTGARPGYGWLSEESEDSARRLDCERTFIIDPIDGTRAFIKGEKGFSHSLAVACNGTVESAVVYLPALDLLYTATRGGPALLNGAPLTPSSPLGSEGVSALTNATALQPEFWPGGVPNLHRAFRPSLAWRLCLVAEGEHDALITLRDAWEWDIAAGCLIAEAAGVRVTDRNGGPLRFNAPTPLTAGVIAAPPALHAELLTRRHGA